MASDQQFCLRWNNHQSTLVSVFDNLLESQTLVDCTLAADGQYLKAHKVVLSACSPYLEAILCQNLDKHPILILKDVKFSELKAMLDYMYRGEVNISQEQLSTFLKAAESLQIKGLTDSGGGGINDRDPPKRQDLRKPLNQPVPHIPQPRPVVPHPGLMERRSLPHFPPHIADMQPQSPRHAREGSTSPTARKRRRPNRPSSDDSNFVSTPNSLSENQPDTSDSCDVPVKQATSSTPNVPNATTKAPETDSNRTTPQPQNNQQNSEQKQQVTVKKEFSETLLTPKTEFDYGNDNSMEDVTYEDDEEEEVDLSKPGTSFAANSQGFPPWQMGGDGSNDDSNNMYSQDVTAATNQNNSQGEKNSSLIKGKSPISKNSPQKKIVTWDQSPSRLRRLPKEIQVSPRSDKNQVNNGSPVNSPGKGRDNCVKTSGYGKRALCSGCDEYVLKGVIRLHKKYYCGKEFDEKEWKINGRKGVCRRCCKSHEPDSIEFHVKYICGKKPITVQCFYCPNLYRGYRNLLSHMNLAHKKRHCFLDLISVLPAADSIGSKNSTPKIVKNFFSSMLNTQQEAVVAENKMSYSPFVQLRDKTTHKCESCGKNLMGTHEYVNHVNTKCESEKKYPCFYCSFKSILAYEVLDHMEENHGKTFNTFDIIQARLTGIIPMIDEDLNNTASLTNESPTSKTSGSPRKPIKREELDIIAKPSFSNEKHSSVNDCQTTVVSVGECPGKNYQDGDNLSLNELKAFFVTENNDEVSHRKVNDKRVKIENSDSATPVKKISIQNESGDVNKSFEVDKSQIVDQTYSQERKLNADGFGRKGSRDSPGSLSNNQTSVSVTSKNTICASENKNRLSHNPLPEPDSFVSETPDEVIVCESPIPGCSLETFQLRNSFTENSKGSMLTGGCKSPVKVVGKKSPKHAYIKQEDPEIGFANEKLFEPYLNTPSRVSQSKTNNKVDFKNKNKLVMKQEFSNMKENGTGEEISSDSEVDFANKELFEPYSTPIKVTRASLVSSKLNKKNEEINKGDSPSKRERKSAHPTSNNEDKKKKIGKKKKTALSCNGDEILSDRVVSKKALLRANKITKSIVCRSKVNFNVSRKKIVIGKKVVKAISKKTAAPKINCPKCQKDVHPGNLRIHNRYHCLNEPTKKQWILYAGKAYCLKCRKFRSSDSIDFHVKFVCTKKKLSFQCFYCTKILKDIRSVLVHMFKAHGKKHYFQDFMTILTEAENGSPQKTPQAELVQTEPKQSPKVLRHPVIFYAPMKTCGQDVSANLEDRLEEHYGCLYCEHQDLMAYKTLDHMEDVHNKKHNMYDLLYAKIPATLKEKELDCAESSNGS